MKKKIFAILFALVLCFSSVIFASAKTDSYILDPDKHLKSDELSQIQSYGDMIERSYGYAVIFCITSDTDGVSTTDYCEKLYPTVTDSAHGIIITHNTTEKVYSYYCKGNATNVFNDNAVRAIWELYDTNESYYGGLVAFYEAAEIAVENARINPGTTVQTENNTTEAVKENEETTEFVNVERKLPLVVDNAELLSDNEEKELITKLEAFAGEHKMELGILTVKDLGDKTPEEYADDFYDYNGYGYGENDDGMLVLYKPGEEGKRKLHITTHGTAREEIGGAYNDILDAMIDYLVAEDYVSAFNTYISMAEKIVNPSVSLAGIIICIAIGFVVAFVVVKSMTSGNRSVRSKVDAAEYSRQGSMIITGSIDSFVRSHVTRTEKAKKDDDDGSHESSSGRTHGGGGRSF